MVVSAAGYFFSIITVFTTLMTFMALLIGLFDHSTFEKVRHYPHPRPVIERTITPTNPEPQRRMRVQRIRAALPSQKQSPKTVSLNKKSSPKGLRIFTNLKSWHDSARTMGDTAMGWL